MDFLPLKGRQDEPSLALLSSTTGTTQTVNIRLAFARETHLDDVCDVWEVHTTCGYIRREEDARLSEAEVVSGPCSLCLRELRVNFKSTEAGQRVVALEATAELVKY